MVVSPKRTRDAFLGDLDRGRMVGGRGGDGGRGGGRGLGTGMKLARGPRMARCSGFGEVVGVRVGG